MKNHSLYKTLVFIPALVLLSVCSKSKENIDPQTQAALDQIDAQACCQQGIEFKYDFKDKVPPQDSVLLITGKFTLTETKEGLCRNFILADSVESME